MKQLHLINRNWLILAFLISISPFHGMLIAAEKSFGLEPITANPETTYQKISRVLSIPLTDAKVLVKYVQKKSSGQDISPDLIKKKNRALKRTVVPAAIVIAFVAGALGIQLYKNYSTRQKNQLNRQEDGGSNQSTSKTKTIFANRLDKQKSFDNLRSLFRNDDLQAVKQFLDSYVLTPKELDDIFTEALENGSADAVSMMLDKGANVLSRNRGANTLDRAFNNNFDGHDHSYDSRKKNENQASIIELLVKAGVPVDLRVDGLKLADSSMVYDNVYELKNVTFYAMKLTPLMNAVIRGNAPLVRKLLELGADKEAKDSDGKLPFVRKFFSSMGDKDFDEHTVYYYADRSTNHEIKKLIGERK